MADMEDSSELSFQLDESQETEESTRHSSNMSESSEIEFETTSEIYGGGGKNISDGGKPVMSPEHPTLIPFQQNFKEQLQSLIKETDEQLTDLSKTIKAQEKENDHFAKQGYEFQKELKLQDEKLDKIVKQCTEQLEKKQTTIEKWNVVKQSFQAVEERWKSEMRKDLDYQKTLEDISFEVVQLTSVQDETFTDAKSLQRAVEKTAKDRENLELQKLRQDLLIARMENDRFNLENKISLYKNQCAIKKEEVADLRKELNAAHIEMEVIQFEKQQIVHQWKQSLASLEKQDRVLSDIRISARGFEDDLQTLNMEIAAHKKSVRKELERNETLTVQLQFRESDIARTEKELRDAAEKENNLQENLSVIEQIIEITENELKFLNDSRILKEKELEAKENDIQKSSAALKSLEKKQTDVLHEKITVTKASKYTEKIIKDLRNSISSNEDKGSKKESEKEKLLLQIDNKKSLVINMKETLTQLQKESKQRTLLLDKSDASVVKTRDKIHVRQNEYKTLENELLELIAKAGGQELAPYERELANLRKEIHISEQGKRDMEQEYLRYQRELFNLSKQRSVQGEEIDMYKKKIVIMEGKKIQLEADIAKEEKNIKDTQNRIHQVERDLANINKLLSERKELQECLEQASYLSKTDFNQALKSAELNYLQKQSALSCIRKKKRKSFCKVMELQKYIVFWEQKLHVADETRKILKSEAHLDALFQIQSEIRCLKLKQEKIKKEQEKIVADMRRAVYRHTTLYIEADKQALFGKRRKTPEYVKKTIKNNKKKLIQDGKDLEQYSAKIELLKKEESDLIDAINSQNILVSENMHKISCTEQNTDCKKQEKRQAVIKLSFKQKKGKFLQKFKDKTYIRAIRNEEKRPEEITKIENGLRAVQVIIQATVNEHPSLGQDLHKILDYIIVSKEI